MEAAAAAGLFGEGVRMLCGILDRVGKAMPAKIGGLNVVDKVTIDGNQFIMEDGGWLLIRFSGTEPIIRVYCETTHEDKVQAILNDGMKIMSYIFIRFCWFIYEIVLALPLRKIIPISFLFLF